MKKPYWQRASYSDKVISFLLSARSPRVQRHVLRSLVEARDKSNKKAFAQSLYNLKKKGFIKIDKNKDIFFDHKKYLQKMGTKIYFENKESSVGVIIMFDIPEEKRQTRDWLRRQLKLWDFKMVQKSVWFGKGELTSEFKNHLSLLKIKKDVKVFNASQIRV